MTFHRKGRVLMAMSKAPTELIWLIKVNWGSYSATRLGMPLSPSQCCGPKQKLKPMNVSAQWKRPKSSFSMRPVNFGYQ